MKSSFSGMLGVVTGGGTGMGRAICEALAAEGCNVALCDVDIVAAAETQALCVSNSSPFGRHFSTFFFARKHAKMWICGWNFADNNGTPCACRAPPAPPARSSRPTPVMFRPKIPSMPSATPS